LRENEIDIKKSLQRKKTNSFLNQFCVLQEVNIMMLEVDDATFMNLQKMQLYVLTMAGTV